MKIKIRSAVQPEVEPADAVVLNAYFVCVIWLYASFCCLLQSVALSQTAEKAVLIMIFISYRIFYARRKKLYIPFSVNYVYARKPKKVFGNGLVILYRCEERIFNNGIKIR